MPTMTYLQAISDGLRTEMRRDERVLVMGEDIGTFGGAFKVTDGFIEEFGSRRVMDTPLAESGIVGTAVGAAVVGLRPVCEMQFADFVSCGFDQLVNVAGKMYYRQGLPVNITVRLPSGGGFSGGPFHSQNPEAWFMHAPGLKVVAPSTPADAKGLLIGAVRDPNPVIFLEHKHLYRRVRGEVADGAEATPFTARVAREGTDLVVIAYGAMVHTALEATEDLEGASVQVLDLRSLVPLDEEAILAAVRSARRWSSSTRPTARAPPARRSRRSSPRRASRTSTGRSCGCPRPTCRSRSRHRWSRRCCPTSIACGRRAVSSSPTETLVDVAMPQMGVSVAEGTIVAWHKQVGDWVEADETLAEVTTDKIDTEIPSPATGRLAEVLVEPGVTVDIGTPLARIATDARPGEAHVAETEPEPPSHPRRYSPVVQRIAAEHGIDLDAVRGTGRDGRVRKQDVLALVDAPPAAEDPPLHTESPYRPDPSPRRRRGSSSRACAARSAST